MHIIEEKWDDILQHVKEEHELSDVSFDTWIRPLRVHEADDSVVTILVPTEQVGLDYVSKKYKLPIKAAIGEITGLSCEVYFELPEDVEKAGAEKETRRFSIDTGLDPSYTFDNFVVGSNNKFAHAAALAVAESPGKMYNPLFLYSAAGLGKTHLLHSIAHFILENHTDLKLLSVTAEQFTNEVIASIRDGRNVVLDKMREKFRNVDVLLVDDIQFIIGKESTQEEFFYTFNELREAGKQIVITSDRPPKDMEILEERMRSRFEWGLMADIQKPDFETRMAILHKKQERDGTHVDDSVLQYIAENVNSNIRELEGSLNKILFKANVEKLEITPELAEIVLSDVIHPEATRVVSPEFIIETVAEHHGLTLDDMKSSTRSRNVSHPRHIAMYLCRNMLGTGLQTIGDILGGRDHASVMHGARKIESQLPEDPALQETIAILKKKISPQSDQNFRI